MDALGLRLRHSERALHLELSPESALERIVFDLAEQFRCESLVDRSLAGVPTNIAAAFDAWSERARGENIAETGVGVLIYTLAHMLRYRLVGIPASEQVDDVIEATRFNLAKLVGHALRELPGSAHSQSSFAVPAREIARLVAEMADDAGDSLDASSVAAQRHRLLIPIDWETLNEELASVAAGGIAPAIDADYRVFTTVHDVEVRGSELYREEALRRLRRELDHQIDAQAVSITRLAQRLQRLFPAWQVDGWSHGEDEGLIDPARLGQIVANPMNPHVRRLPSERPTGEAAISFLIDTSGSMKVQRHETVAVLVDTLVRALELAGVSSEVLGFTTTSWAGGTPAAEWRAAGSPVGPGRLAAIQHIVYKDADTTWKQGRLSLAAMMRTDHYREGVDGEALEWAHARLMQRLETRRALVIISDGTPMEVTTAINNRDDFLADHLRAVAMSIESPPRRSQPGVLLGAVGIDDDLGDYIANSITVDLRGTLTIGDYDVLHRLFG